MTSWTNWVFAWGIQLDGSDNSGPKIKIHNCKNILLKINVYHWIHEARSCNRHNIFSLDVIGCACTGNVCTAVHDLLKKPRKN